MAGCRTTRCRTCAPDPDVVVDFQAIFGRAFDQGDYSDSINYDQRPEVALSEADLQWAAELAHG